MAWLVIAHDSGLGAACCADKNLMDAMWQYKLEHLDMTLVAGSLREDDEVTHRSAVDAGGKVTSEFSSPSQDCLMRNHDAAFRQQILDHPQTERKPEVQPNRLRNHVRWETVAMIEW